MTSADDDVDIALPVRLTYDPGTVSLAGAGARYEKRIVDLTGLYRDESEYRLQRDADPDRLVYWVDESRAGDQPGALIIGLSVLLPGRIGREFAMTRGHLHAKAGCAELYQCVSGRGVMLMDDPNGRTVAMELTPGIAAHVPGGWVHRSVNVGEEPFVTLFCYDSDAGQDYGIIATAGGMRELIVADGDNWASIGNPDHVGYKAAAA